MVGRSQLIKVAFTAGDAERAAAGANALADAYIDVKREERGDVGVKVAAAPRPSSGGSLAGQEIAETASAAHDGRVGQRRLDLQGSVDRSGNRG